MSSSTCCIPGCRRHMQDKSVPDSVLHFYSFPGRAWEIQRKKKWVRAVRMAFQFWGKDDTQWEPNKNTKICNAHFIGGVKANDPRHAGYNPTIFPSLFLGEFQEDTAIISDTGEKIIFTSDLTKYSTVTAVKSNHEVYLNAEAANWAIDNVEQFTEETDPLDIELPTSAVPLAEFAPTLAKVKIKVVKKKVLHKRKPRMMDVAVATSNESKENLNIKRLTGLSSPFLTELFYLFQWADHGRYRKLTQNQRFFLFLVKIKSGMSFASLALTFGISTHSASSFFAEVLNTLYDMTCQWLTLCAKATAKSTGAFSKYAAMIDCFEILTECPKDVLSEKELCSSNTKRYTFKFLIGVSPQGSVLFVSEAQGGSASKARVLEGTRALWLSCIQEGDLVAIGKGCLELKVILEAKGAVPVQFDSKNGGYEDLQELAACRRQFERTLQKLKRFEILRHISPEFSLQIDKIVYMCCVLSNHKLLKPAKNN